MSTRYYSNTAAQATLAASVVGANTSLLLDTTSGFPATTPFTLVIDPDSLSAEVVTVTAVAGTTVTVTRGEDGTSAVAHDAGAAVVHAHSARDFADSRTHEAASIGVHGLTGTVVGTSDTQTLTNKNLTTGNTFPSSLATLTGAQALTNKDLTSATNSFPTSLVTLTGTQTLTNKSLTSPTLTGSPLVMTNITLDPGASLTVLGTNTVGSWTSYTPSLTNLTVGNGTLQARYLQFGKTIDVSILLTVGTTTSATGAIQFSLPVTAHAQAVASGGAVSQTSPYSAGVPFLNSTTSIQVIDGAGASWSASKMASSGNKMYIGLRYEAA